MDESNRQDANAPQREPLPANKKRPYHAPTIEDFGSVADMTAGAPMTMMAEAPSNGYSTSAM